MFDLEMDRWEQTNMLPLDNPSPEEAAAYALLEQAILTGSCAEAPAMAVPASSAWGLGPLLGGIAVLGAAMSRRMRARQGR